MSSARAVTVANLVARNVLRFLAVAAADIDAQPVGGMEGRVGKDRPGLLRR